MFYFVYCGHILSEIDILACCDWQVLKSTCPESPAFRAVHLLYSVSKQTTSALGHDWMLDDVDVRTTQCFKKKGEQTTWSCVFTMLCDSGDVVKKGELSVQNALQEKKEKKKKTASSFQWSFFLSSDLYIKCNVRSCQYSYICQFSVCHLWLSISVSGGDAKIGCFWFQSCLFFTWILILIITHSAIWT